MNWSDWCESVKSQLGHSLDGDFMKHGYSLNNAYGAWKEGLTPEQFVGITKQHKQIIRAARRRKVK